MKYSHRKLTKVITWTTALRNSVKLGAMVRTATQEGGAMAIYRHSEGALNAGEWREPWGQTLDTQESAGVKVLHPWAPDWAASL